MYIKRTEFDIIKKRLAEYGDTNYNLQLENETLKEIIKDDTIQQVIKDKNKRTMYQNGREIEIIDYFVRGYNDGHKEEIRTIKKQELEDIIKQCFDYEEVEIEKVCAGAFTSGTFVYPSLPALPLLFKMDIRYRRKRAETKVVQKSG